MPFQSKGITNKAIGSDKPRRGMDIIKLDDYPFRTKYEQVNSALKYTGYATDQSALGSQALWKIKRELLSGGVWETEWAGVDFDAIWANRSSIFSSLPYSNVYSLLMDGINDRISVPHASSININASQAFSIGKWLKTSDTSAGTLFYKGSASQRLDIGYDASGRIVAELRGGGLGDRIRVREDTDTIDDLTWRLILFTYDGGGNASGANIYVGGVSTNKNILNDTLTTDFQNTANLAIGAKTGGGGEMQGFQDEPFIFYNELSSAQALALANTPPQDLNLYASNNSLDLRLWYSYDDDDIATFPTVADQSGNGNDGTLTDMVVGSFTSEVAA